MKLIHISDTHLGRGDNTLRFERVVDDLLANPPDAPQNCIIVHTGDLLIVQRDANRQAGRLLLDRLATRFRVLLCPGNHDYGDALSVDKEAAHAFQQVFGAYIFQGKPPAFPVVNEVGNHIFIGLDSNAEELRFWERWFAEGHLGGKQLVALNHLLDSAELAGRQVVVYLHHHPFTFGYSVMPDVGDRNPLNYIYIQLTRPFLRLKDAFSLCQVLRDRAHLLLFGHMHFGLDCSGECRKYGMKLAFDGDRRLAPTRYGQDALSRDRLGWFDANCANVEVVRRGVGVFGTQGHQVRQGCAARARV